MAWRLEDGLATDSRLASRRRRHLRTVGHPFTKRRYERSKGHAFLKVDLRLNSVGGREEL